MNDLKFAFRQLLKNPGFTAVAVLTLAVCLGANLAIFSVVEAILVRPLPFPEPDRLVTLFNTYPKAGIDRNGASLANYYERRGQLPAFSQVALFSEGTGIVGESGTTEHAKLMRVSPDFFATLGSGPRLGRPFTDQETSFQTDNVAILTDTCWRLRFHSDPGILGRQIRVDGVQKEIVGVLPPDFRFLSSRPLFYLPLSSNPADRASAERHTSNGYQMIGRLRPGVSLAEAQAEIDANNELHARDFPDAKVVTDAGFRSVVAPLRADHVRAIRPALLLAQAGVFLLLLIGGVNLVNLLLVRASGRSRELAIRQSLGATQARVIKQVMTETLLLCSLGGLLALVCGYLGIRLLALLGVEQLPLGADVRFNGVVALAALLGALAVGVVIALLLAWFNLRGQIAADLQASDRAGGATHAAQRLRQGFIVAQIALAFVLLAGAGLLTFSLKQAMASALGFRPDHILSAHISLPWAQYPDWPRRIAFVDRFLDRVRAQPGVAAVGVMNHPPFTGRDELSAFTIQGRPRVPGASLVGHAFFGVAGDPFTALGIPLREGRFLTDTDFDRRVCVVDDEFARYYWPNGGAVGARLFLGVNEGPPEEAYTVVGIVGATRKNEITEQSGKGAVYVPYQFRTVVSFFPVIRTSGSPEALGPALQKIVRDLDPELPVFDVLSMEHRIADSLVARRSPTMLAGLFALVALLLAALGAYGILAFTLSQRRREIGVRLALGASPRQIAARFVVMGLRLLGLGLLLGLPASWLAGRALRGMLYQVSALHPLPLLAAAGALGAATLIASLLPSLRASRINPVEALRHE